MNMQKLCYPILLVEDDADDRYIMHQAFEELNFEDEVKMFSSGIELLNYLGHLSPKAFPELVILDYNMPALNGAELAFQLKKHPEYNIIPIAIYSTGMNPKMKCELIEAGVINCYEKGMAYHDTLELVRSFKEVVEGFESTGPVAAAV